MIDPVTGQEEIVFLAIADWWASDLESFQNQNASSLNITAISSTTVALISRYSFDELLEKLPKLEKYFRIILQNQVTALLRRIYFRNAQDAKSRYRAFLQKYPSLNAKIPQYLIAFDQIARINKTFSFDLSRGDFPIAPILSGKK